jgi:Protein of unknown function (DUF2909)
MKYYFITAFIVIVGCLASAGVFLLKDTGKDINNPVAGKKRMAWALTWRIGLSVALFISIWIFYSLGWIKPTGLPINAVQ